MILTGNVTGAAAITSGVGSNTVCAALNKNQITIIGSNLFTGSSNLKTLDLSENLISHVQQNAFNGLGQLTSLN